jgi:hypothetical protein
VVVSLASGFPLQKLFRRICDRLRSSPVRRIEVRPLRC